MNFGVQKQRISFSGIRIRETTRLVNEALVSHFPISSVTLSDLPPGFSDLQGRMSSSFRSVTYETSSAGSGSGHDVEDQDDDEAGIGICLVQQKGKFIIDSLEPGGAAEKSGNVLVGDVIMQIEGGSSRLQHLARN